MTRVVFMGSPDFALPALRALAEHYEVAGVVTQPDRASGRGRALKSPPVKLLARELGIPVIQPEKLKQPEALEQLRLWSPDLIVVAAFGQILRKDVLDLPPLGCINVHASLLPRWRGAAPINAAILHGDQETGITIMKMDAGLDTGPMLRQRSIRLTRDDTAGSVFEALSHLGADLLIETLPDYLSGEIQPVPQPEEGATYAPMLKKEEGRLDFTRPAEELERRVRAFNPWPGAFMDFEGALLKVHRAHTLLVPPIFAQSNSVAAEDEQGRKWGDVRGAEVGQRLVHRDQPAVAAGGGILILDEVQPAGKKSMSGKSFLAGTRNWASR
ncbi:MAG: methionyl-tRNA formyltransferase [Anaerolineales bacterium]|nr:methionyl-tRNA formyltransferase [Anaerolineales bacterium]